MIHYFIINPVAGSVDSSLMLEEKLKSIFANRNDEKDIDCIYVAQKQRIKIGDN